MPNDGQVIIFITGLLPLVLYGTATVETRLIASLQKRKAAHFSP
jgi:hypothetical protein